MYLFREGGRVLLLPMYTYEPVLENGKRMGSQKQTNQLDLDEHEVTNVLNRLYCLMRPDGQCCYSGDLVVILLLLPVQLSCPHIAPLA